MQMPSTIYLCKRLRILRPATNIYHWNNKNVTDTIFFDTPTVNDSPTCSQLSTGRNSKFNSVHMMKDTTSTRSIIGVF